MSTSGGASGGVTFPLTNATDETFQPNGIANNTLTLHNNAAAVNGVQLTGAATGLAPLLSAVGTDANIGININPKGTGVVNVGGVAAAAVPLVVQGAAAGQTADLLDLYQNGGGNLLFSFQTAANGADGFAFRGAAAGGAVQIQAAGTDANIPMNISPKGTGNLQIFPVNGANSGFTVIGVANLANGWTLTPATAGNGPTFGAMGTDANISVGIQSKGTGNVGLQPGGLNALIAFGVAAAVNYIGATASATGLAPSIIPGGSDANIDLTIAGKGTGVINYGYAVTALGGGVAAVNGTIGGSGPATATQNSWLAVKINGTTSFLPVWR